MCRCYGICAALVKRPIAFACFAGRTAARGQGQNLDHADPGAQRQGEDVARADRGAGALDPPSVEPHVPFLDPGLRQRSAGREAQEPEQAVDPHYRTRSARAAKALPLGGAGRASRWGSAWRRTGRQRQRGGTGGPNWPSASGRGVLAVNPASRSRWIQPGWVSPSPSGCI